MTPDVLAQWRNDGAVMKAFQKSPEWAVLKRHLEEARDRALAMGDGYQPDQVEHVMHYRSVRLGILDALTLPEAIVANAANIEAQAKAEAERVASQAQRTSRVQRGPR